MGNLSNKELSQGIFYLLKDLPTRLRVRSKEV